MHNFLIITIALGAIILSGCGSDSGGGSPTPGPTPLPEPNPHLDYSLQTEENGSLTGIWLIATDHTIAQGQEIQNDDLLNSFKNSGYLKQILWFREISDTEVELNLCGIDGAITYQREANTLTHKMQEAKEDGSTYDYHANFEFDGNNGLKFSIKSKEVDFYEYADTTLVDSNEQESHGRGIKISNSDSLIQWKQDSLVVNYLFKDGQPIIAQPKDFPIHCFTVSEVVEEYENYHPRKTTTITSQAVKIASHADDGSIIEIYKLHDKNVGEECLFNNETQEQDCFAINYATTIVNYMQPNGNIFDEIYHSIRENAENPQAENVILVEGEAIHAQGTISTSYDNYEMRYEFYLNH
ncbi:MAG: hypothetical protein OXE99_06345 [Cellvibrionales bacterium]|nr:hypothetical protein [Cellvibrionales bacterium]